MGKTSAANYQRAMSIAFAQAADDALDAQFDLDLLTSDIIRSAQAQGISMNQIARWFGKGDGNRVRPLVHSCTARKVKKLPAGFLPRVTVANTLGVGVINIHSGVLAGTITDEVFYQGDWFIRLSS